MANERFYATGKLQDRQIIQLIDDIAGTFEEGCRISYGFANVEVDADSMKASIGEGTTSLIQRATLNGPGNRFIVYFRRDITSPGLPDGSIQIERRVSSPYLDEIIIAPTKHQPSIEDFAKLDAVITKHTAVKLPASATGGVDGIVDVLHREISELAAFHKKMLEDTEKQRRDLDQAFQRKQQEIEARAEQQREELKKQAEAERERVASLRTELEEKQKALDDRDHMHARRALRASITEEIENRVSGTMLPASVGGLNAIISALSLAGAAFAAFVALDSFLTVRSVVSIDTAGGPTSFSVYFIVAELVRGALASIATVGLLLYTIGWLRRVYLSNVKATQDMQKYSLDINRASWTIETIMEMTTKEGRVLPDKWIEGACYGLFRSSEQEHAEITPMEAWTALLSGSAKVQHGPDGTLLELSGKDAKKIAKKQDSQ